MRSSRLAAFFTSLSFFVIAALVAGVVVGAMAQGADAPWLTGGLGVVESLGQVWLNALRMTVIPLVFSLLVTGIVSIADAAATGRIAARSLMVFGVLLVGATVYAILAGLGLLALWPIDPEAGRALLAGTPADSAAVVGEAARTDGLRAFLSSLAPANVVKAAADDGVLAVVVFAVAFGFAATRIKTELRRPLAGFFEAVAETMVVHRPLGAAGRAVRRLRPGAGRGAACGFGRGRDAGPLCRHRLPQPDRPDPDHLCRGGGLGSDFAGPVRPRRGPGPGRRPSRPSRPWPACRS